MEDSQQAAEQAVEQQQTMLETQAQAELADLEQQSLQHTFTNA